MANGSKERSRGLAVYSWVLYDFANTIFSISILPGVAAGRGAGRGLRRHHSRPRRPHLFRFRGRDRPLRARTSRRLGRETGEEPNSNAFLPTAVLYLLFSLPAFFFVPDPVVRAQRPVALGAAYRNVNFTVHVPDVRPETTVEEYAPLMQGERAL